MAGLNGNHRIQIQVNLPRIQLISRKTGLAYGLSSNRGLAMISLMIQFIANKRHYASIRSSDNDSTGFWPPGSLHTLGADGYI